MSGQGQASSYGMQPPPQQYRAFVPSQSPMIQNYGQYGGYVPRTQPMDRTQNQPTAMAQPMAQPMAQSMAQSMTQPMSQPEQTPGYVQNMPQQVIAPPPPEPVTKFSSGSAFFGGPIARPEKGLSNVKGIIKYDPFTLNLPSNVSVGTGFGTELQNIQRQYFPDVDQYRDQRGQISSKKAREYNQRLIDLSNDYLHQTAYRNAITDFMRRQGLSGLLGV